MGDAVGGFLTGLVLSSFAMFVWLAIERPASFDDVPLWVLGVAQAGLWAGLLGAPIWASRRKGTGSLAQDFGLQARWSDLGVGLAAGLVTQLLVIPVVYLALDRAGLLDADKLDDVAREITSQAEGGGLIVLSLFIAIGAPVVEELFFRGLLLRSIERRWGTAAAVGLSSVAFGLSHFQSLQLLALVIFGAVLGILTVRTGRLGPAIAAHVSFNAIAVIGLVLT